MKLGHPYHLTLSQDERAALITIADQCGTPSYVTSLDRVEQKISTLLHDFRVLKPEIRYAMKANSNPHLLEKILQLGHGVDVVSLGEFLFARALGFPLERILVTVNNISRKECEELVQAGALLNIGSLTALEAFGSSYPGLSIAIRMNVDVIDGAHENIQTGGDATKFGILLSEITRAEEIISKFNLSVVGLHEHTGSGIKKKESFLLAAQRLLELATPERFPNLQFVDFGGGFAVPYRPEESAICFEDFANELRMLLDSIEARYGKKLRVFFEPGKFLVAEAGFLLVQVQSLKENIHHRFAGTNSGFSQLLRPMLYDAYHHVLPLHERAGKELLYDVVGNICETGDYLAKDRLFSQLREGDLLCIMNAGAYGMTMASEYNMRPLPAEIALQKGSFSVSRKRESESELVQRLLDAKGDSSWQRV